MTLDFPKNFRNLAKINMTSAYSVLGGGVWHMTAELNEIVQYLISWNLVFKGPVYSTRKRLKPDRLGPDCRLRLHSFQIDGLRLRDRLQPVLSATGRLQGGP